MDSALAVVLRRVDVDAEGTVRAYVAAVPGAMPLTQAHLDACVAGGALPAIACEDEALYDRFAALQSTASAMELHCEPGSEAQDEDEAYFASYGSVDVHRTMLLDEPRCRAYQAALEAAAAGSTVLDVGTGTGLLAMMAARARRVVGGGEQHGAAPRQIADNGLGDTVHCARARGGLDAARGRARGRHRRGGWATALHSLCWTRSCMRATAG